jgi:hypothetical protein
MAKTLPSVAYGDYYPVAKLSAYALAIAPADVSREPPLTIIETNEKGRSDANCR